MILKKEFEKCFGSFRNGMKEKNIGIRITKYKIIVTTGPKKISVLEIPDDLTNVDQIYAVVNLSFDDPYIFKKLNVRAEISIKKEKNNNCHQEDENVSNYDFMSVELKENPVDVEFKIHPHLEENDTENEDDDDDEKEDPLDEDELARDLEDYTTEIIKYISHFLFPDDDKNHKELRDFATAIWSEGINIVR